MNEPVHVLHMVPDMNQGGGQIHLLRAIRGLAPEAFQSSVCAVWHDGPQAMTAEFTEAGVPVYNLQLRRLALPWAARRLAGWVRRLGVDLIHTNNSWWERRFGVLAGALTGVPVVNSFHSMLFDPGHPWVDMLDERLCRGRLSAALAVSHAARDAWLPFARRVGLEDRDVRVVYPGIDVDAYRARLPAAAERRLRSELVLPSQGPVLLNVARLTPGKGQEQLLRPMREVVARWPNATLLLAGDGEERPRIEAAIREEGLGARVRALGQRDDVGELLALADLFVFPSAGEGLGLAVLEAMAARKPVVAFDLPALRELLVDRESGVLVPHDTGRLTEAILALLAARDARLRLGEAARAVARRFSPEASASGLEAFYRDALAAARATRSAERGAGADRATSRWRRAIAAPSSSRGQRPA